MDYADKVSKAHDLIKTVLGRAVNPAVMCSFGKDSMVVLHMLKQHVASPKAVFHREPFQHHKYQFSSRMIAEWDLHVVDYPPSATSVQDGETEFEVVNMYQTGPAKYVYLPTGFRPPCGGKLICALDDVYNKPTGTFIYPFDWVFIGHKSVDVDPVLGAVPLGADISVNDDCPSVAFPIRHFTNEDIWRYTEEQGIPIHHERYEKTADGWREREDKTNNPDYINACTACMSAKSGPSVYCPKLGCSVANVSSRMRKTPAPELQYLQK